MEAELPWPNEWLRGVIELCVLKVIGDQPTYGYAIGCALADAGLGQPKGGTLYPLLSRFQEAGWVTAQWQPGDGGPGRKFYEITDQGRKVLDMRIDEWLRFSATVSAQVTGQSPHPQKGIVQ